MASYGAAATSGAYGGVVPGYAQQGYSSYNAQQDAMGDPEGIANLVYKTRAARGGVHTFGANSPELRPQPGEDFEAYKKRLYSLGWGFRPEDFESVKTGKYWGTVGRGGKDKAGAKEDVSTPLTDPVTQATLDLIKFLQQPVNLESPYAKNVLQTATRSEAADLAGRGIRGGLSGAATEKAYMNAALGLEAQRQDRLAQALGMGSGRDIGLQNVGLGLQNVQLGRANLAENQYQFDVGQAYKNYLQNVESNQGILGFLGGLGGGAAGFLAGGAPGAALGYSAGSKMLGGLGGTGQTWTPPSRF